MEALLACGDLVSTFNWNVAVRRLFGMKPANIRRRQNRLASRVDLQESRLLLSATMIQVTTTADVVDADDGVVSLREAVQEANAGSGDFEIQLVGGTYKLSIAGANEDAAATGDLDLYASGNVMISGWGPQQTTIDASGLDRIFDVRAGGTVTLLGLTLTGGSADRGGAISNQGSLIILNSTIRDNWATGLFGPEQYTDFIPTTGTLEYGFDGNDPELYFGNFPLTSIPSGYGSLTASFVASAGTFEYRGPSDPDYEPVNPDFQVIVSNGRIDFVNADSADILYALDDVYWVAPEDADTSLPAATMTTHISLDDGSVPDYAGILLLKYSDQPCDPILSSVQGPTAAGGAIDNRGSLAVRTSTFSRNTVEPGMWGGTEAVDYVSTYGTLEYAFSTSANSYLGLFDYLATSTDAFGLSLQFTTTSGSFEYREPLDSTFVPDSPNLTVTPGSGSITISSGSLADLAHVLSHLYWVSPGGAVAGLPAAEITVEGFVGTSTDPEFSSNLHLLYQDRLTVPGRISGGGAIFNQGVIDVKDSTFVENTAYPTIDPGGGKFDYILKSGALEYPLSNADLLLTPLDLDSFDEQIQTVSMTLLTTVGTFEYRPPEDDSYVPDSPWFSVDVYGGRVDLSYASLADILHVLPYIVWVAADGADTNTQATIIFTEMHVDGEPGSIIFNRLHLMYADQFASPFNPANGQSYVGGAIANVNGGVILSNSTFSANLVAVGSGGGIYNLNGEVSISSSTFADNFAFFTGNTIYNTSRPDSVGIVATPATVSVANSILGNWGDRSEIVNERVEGGVAALLFASGSNLTASPVRTLGDAQSSEIDVTCACALQLGDLDWNGGPTQTYALLPGSIAIDAGDPAFYDPTTPYDQRGPGYGRVIDGRIDIGAYEASRHPPAGLALSSTGVLEHQSIDTLVGTFSATDPDTGNTFTYMLAAGAGDTDNGSFTIVDDQLLTNAVFDYATKKSYSIRVRVTDSDGLTFIKIFTISVTSENLPPTALVVSSTSVVENKPIGTVVGTLSATGSDPGNTFTYSLASGAGDTDNGSFTIDGDQLKTNAVFNFVAKNGYSIRIRVTDNNGLTLVKTFTIAVTSENHAPTGLALSATSVVENKPAGTVVGTFSATDPDAGNTFTYTLATGAGDTDNGSFTIDGNQLKTSAVFDRDTKSTYSIRVRVTDNGGFTFIRIFAISVKSENHPPTALALSSTSVMESQPIGTVVGTFSATDPDAGSTFTYMLATAASDTDNGSFTIVGNQLKTNSVFELGTKSSYSIRVRVTDNDGLTFIRIFTITVRPVNNAPTGLSLSSTSVAENQPVGTTVGTFTATDPDVGSTLTYTLAAGNGSTDNGSFTITGSELKTNAVFDYEGKKTYSIRVRVTDNGGLTFIKIFTISVNDSVD